MSGATMEGKLLLAHESVPAQPLHQNSGFDSYKGRNQQKEHIGSFTRKRLLTSIDNHVRLQKM